MNVIKFLEFLKTQRLTITTFISVVLGVIVGCCIRATSSSPWHQRDIMYLNFIGEIFMRMLKCLILPLMASSIMTAIGSLDLSLSKKIGARAVAFYLTTTFLSVVLGIVLTVTIQPGSNKGETSNRTNDDHFVHNKPHVSTTVDTLLDLLRNLFPPNIVQACTKQYQTNLTQQLGNPSEGNRTIQDLDCASHYASKFGYFLTNFRLRDTDKVVACNSTSIYFSHIISCVSTCS